MSAPSPQNAPQRPSPNTPPMPSLAAGSASGKHLFITCPPTQATNAETSSSNANIRKILAVSEFPWSLGLVLISSDGMDQATGDCPPRLPSLRCKSARESSPIPDPACDHYEYATAIDGRRSGACRPNWKGVSVRIRHPAEIRPCLGLCTDPI